MSRKATWLIVAAVGWVALVVLLVWMKAQPASGWRVVEAPVTVVAGGLAAVVAGALLFDPVKQWVAKAAADELEAREDQRWLTDRYPHARATQDVLRQMTALGSALLYEAVASTGALRAVIPSETLRRDVRRLPPAPPFEVGTVQGEQAWRDALVAHFQAVAEQFEAIHQDRTGPMAVAERQFSLLSRALDPPVMLDSGEVVPAADEHWDWLDDATVEALATCPDATVADRLALLTSRMLDMVNEVTATRGFDPAPLKKSVLLLVARAERVRCMVSSPAWRACVSYNGGVDGGSSNDPWAEARSRMYEVSALFRELMHVRSELRKATAATFKAASRLGEDTQNAWAHDPFPQDDILGNDFAWDLWRQRNHLECE